MRDEKIIIIILTHDEVMRTKFKPIKSDFIKELTLHNIQQEKKIQIIVCTNK